MAAAQPQPVPDATEVLHGELVPAEDAPGADVAATRAQGVAVVKQAGVLAGASFAAGLAAVAAVRVAGATRSTRKARRARRNLPVVATRTFLVDVHLLDPGKR